MTGGSGISWTICKSFAPHSRQITTTVPHHSVFTGRMPFLMFNKQHQSTEGIACLVMLYNLTTTTTILRPSGFCPGLRGWAGTRKVKPVWILLKQETVSGSGINWAICKSAPCPRQITTPVPHHHHSVFLQAGCPSCCPTNSVKALKANFIILLIQIKAAAHSSLKYRLLISLTTASSMFQCFDAIGWAVGSASSLKKLSGGCWRGYLSGRGANLHMAQLTTLPLTVCCFSKIRIGFTFLVPAQPGSPRQRTIKLVLLLLAETTISALTLLWTLLTCAAAFLEQRLI